MRKAQKKDMDVIKNKTTSFRDAIEKKIGRADLKDHGGHATISIMWNLNEDAIRDQVFVMEINGQKAYIDLEELLSYTRLI
jgi:hypothetical protein